MVALVRGWSSARALTVVAALTVAGCAKAGIPVGSVDADNVALAGSPLFAHYQGVLSGASTVGDLLRNRLAFSGRPTPTALLQSMQAANPSAAADAVPMSIVTFNVGLLDASLFGVVQYARTPDLEARAALMANAVFAQGYDVLGLQEVWRPADVERFRSAARGAGYWVVTSSRAGYTDGLLIAVKTAFAPEPAASEVRFDQFSEISSNEFFPAPGFSRGFLSVRIEHPRLGAIVVYDTHTASFPAAYRLRMSHARELGLHTQRTVRPGELLFVLGDVNAGPYYRADVWNLPNNASEPDWYANTLSYPVLMHYAGVTDLVVRGRTAADATLDITEGDRVLNDPANATRVPFGMAGYCPAVPAAPFTGTDCNALYFQQYAGTEFPARLDHVMGRDTDNRIHVESAPMAFTESVAYAGRMGPLSDHYGQLVRMRIAPRR